MASDKRGTALTVAPGIEQVLAEYRDQYDCSLLELSNSGPMLLVFLRHFGCMFCRETLSDLHDSLLDMERRDVRVVLAHMGSEEDASTLFARYGLAPLSRVSSSDRMLYKAFGLSRAKTGEFLCADAVKRCGQALMSGHSIGRVQGDLLQMPGVFLIDGNRVLHSFRHRHAGDRPDYVRIAAILQKGM